MYTVYEIWGLGMAVSERSAPAKHGRITEVFAAILGGMPDAPRVNQRALVSIRCMPVFDTESRQSTDVWLR